MVHHVRGRLRFKAAELKRNDQRAAAVKKVLQCQQGIRSVEVNVLTGSLLIYYDPEVLSISDVLDIIHIRTRLLPSPARPQPSKYVVTRALIWWVVEKSVERSIVALL